MTAVGVGLVLAFFGAIGAYLWHRARPTPVPPEARHALRYLWVDLWRLDIALMPLLIAVAGRDLNCHSGEGWIAADGRCVAGTSNGHGAGSVATVAFPAGMPLHRTALCHEAAHCRLALLLGYWPNESAAHARVDFTEWISTGNAALAARGE
jgi:hypothetical protein